MSSSGAVVCSQRQEEVIFSVGVAETRLVGISGWAEFLVGGLGRQDHPDTARHPRFTVRRVGRKPGILAILRRPWTNEHQVFPGKLQLGAIAVVDHIENIGPLVRLSLPNPRHVQSRHELAGVQPLEFDHGPFKGERGDFLGVCSRVQRAFFRRSDLLLRGPAAPMAGPRSGAGSGGLI